MKHKLERDTVKKIPVILSILASIGIFAPAQAQEQPVLVELYTSQGCSSCPQADAIFQELARQPGVVALAFHVDYWDYIGWQDSFAQPLFTARQKAYAYETGQNVVYTPQVIVQGQDFLVGSKPIEVAQAIKAQSHKITGIDVNMSKTDHGIEVEISGEIMPESPRPEIFLVEYTPQETVRIERGENQGREWTYVNIVRSVNLVEEYTPPFWKKTFKGVTGNVAVFVQNPNHAEVLGAAITQ